MGTRSLTFFHQDGKPFCAFYRQMDGYPEGHGVELGEILAPITLVNGFGSDMKAGTHANGPGCLAAQVIERLKSEQGLGGIYMISPNPEDHKDGWQEYEYHIHVNSNGDGWTRDRENPYFSSIEVTDTNKIIFCGSFKQFLSWAKNPKRDENEEYIPVIHIPSGGANIAKYAKPELRTALHNGEVNVSFRKADNSVREMRCTQNVDLIPEDKLPLGTSKSLRNDPSLFKVFDLDKNEWRSFREERIINYEVA